MANAPYSDAIGWLFGETGVDWAKTRPECKGKWVAIIWHPNPGPEVLAVAEDLKTLKRKACSVLKQKELPGDPFVFYVPKDGEDEFPYL